MTKVISKVLAVICLISLFSCAKALKDTSGLAEEKVFTVKAPFDKTWLATRDALKELNLTLYTRDKRGLFVAYDQPKREWLNLKRVKYEIQLGSMNPDETKIFISAVSQVYGVTLLTEPDWHDRKLAKTSRSEEILNKILEKLNQPSENQNKVVIKESEPSS
ncbi:MAG: hypothetical protein N3G21_10270 [Candidatus Hydrogenedentes bacterium]|nr:hypothetical protein [Candidatus Hydrogenedentota bacterium]